MFVSQNNHFIIKNINMPKFESRIKKGDVMRIKCPSCGAFIMEVSPPLLPSQKATIRCRKCRSEQKV